VHRRPPGLGATALLGLGLLALLLRLPGLDRSLWYDELFTLTQFARSIGDAATRQIAANNHPLASLLACAASSVSQGEVGLRLPFVFLGALGVVALAWVTSAWVDRRTGLVAGALLAVAPAHVLVSQQVRGYAGALLASAIVLGCFLATLRARPWGGDRLALPGLVLALGLGAWSHATALAVAPGLIVLALAAPSLHLASRRGRRRALGGLAGGVALSALLYAPMLARLLGFVWRHGLLVEVATPLAPGPLEVGQLGEVLGGGSALLAGLLPPLAVLGAVALLRSRRTRLVGLTLLVPVLSAAALLALRPLGYPRFFLFLLPALLVLAGHGLVAAAGRRPWIALGLCVCLAPATAEVRRAAGEELMDYRGAVRLAAARATALGTGVVGAGPGAELLAVYDPHVRVAEDRFVGSVVIVPLPGWLLTPAAPRELLYGGAFADPVVLPGREGHVVVFAPRSE